MRSQALKFVPWMMVGYSVAEVMGVISTSMVLMLWPWFARIKSLGPCGVSKVLMVKRCLSFVSTTSRICATVYFWNVGWVNCLVSVSQKRELYQVVEADVAVCTDIEARLVEAVSEEPGELL
jgi:hypothetical protein